MRVLGLVPARGGSRGVPRKNARLLGGKPLLQYTADAALAARLLTRVVLSTDDAEIAEIGRRCGLDVPFMRPAELARDETPMVPVVRHALEAVEATDGAYDAVCLLQPTAPLRGSEEIDACIELLERGGADTVITVRRVPEEYNPHWVYFADESGALSLSTGEAAPIARRQELPPAFHRDGAVYVARRAVVMERGSLFGDRVLGYVADREHTVNIDGPADWRRAEQLVERLEAEAEQGA
ncbi:MAG TPA: acylneuraminate cytidylyltransferase family protein [Gemmatimonadaceae bacterium]|nr:acylneuraminate cytidylyltransferase family protein [Gemmatimonadaceae bacterium]